MVLHGRQILTSCSLCFSFLNILEDAKPDDSAQSYPSLLHNCPTYFCFYYYQKQEDHSGGPTSQLVLSYYIAESTELETTISQYRCERGPLFVLISNGFYALHKTQPEGQNFEFSSIFKSLFNLVGMVHRSCFYFSWPKSCTLTVSFLFDNLQCSERDNGPMEIQL